MQETLLTRATLTANSLELHYVRTTAPEAVYRVPEGAWWGLAGRHGGPTQTFLVYGDEQQPARPTFAALVTPEVWAGLAPLLK